MRHSALLLEPGEVTVTIGRAGQPVSHPVGHQLAGAHAEQVPGEGRRDVADALGVEHVDRAAAEPQRTGELVQVRAGARGQHRPGVTDDPVGEQPGLVGARRRQEQPVQLERRVQAAAVLGAAEQRGELGGTPGEPGAQAQAGTGPGTVGQRGHPAPPQPQFRQRREPLTGAEPQPQAEPDRPDPPPALAAPGQRHPPEQHQDDEDHQDDERGHLLVHGQDDHAADDGEQETQQGADDVRGSDHAAPPSRSRSVRIAPR